ncbi:MAG: hypothetical protein LCH30_06840 [Proteobacteria bacterium]|nr:hypothetical protein [Pseudomonadota bacterium]
MKNKSESLSLYHSSQRIASQAKKIDDSLLKDDRELTQMLATIELNKDIPQELFNAAAQLLTIFYFIEEKIAEEKGN